MKLTILHIEILLWHGSRFGPYPNKPPIYKRIVDQLMQEGLLKRVESEQEFATSAKGDAIIERMKNILD